MSIRKNLSGLLKQIDESAQLAGRDPASISLVAISKNRTIQEIKEAYQAGCRDFGENRVQEALEKIPQMPSDTRWHFVGKLQKNKIPKVINNFVLIHSIDTPELLHQIARKSVEMDVTTSILLEANTSGEATKSGLNPMEWEKAFPDLIELKGIEIMGLMTMAPLTENEAILRHCFSDLRYLRDRLQVLGKGRVELSTLSMGMSHDFTIAIQEGATIIRIGSALFTPKMD